MTRGLIILVTAATMSAAILPAPAQARNGALAAGIIGGLAAGAIIGGAVASQPRYYGPGPEPVYVAPPPPQCYWTRGEPVWDGYRGVWRRPRMQVCD